jgi:dipeptidyl-peptidase-4
MKSLNLPEAKLMNIKLDSVEVNAWMLKPVDFDKSKKYPVFITVYGGPGNVSVSDHWPGYNYFWYQILASKGYVVLAVDGRGTGGKGTAFKKCTQGKLGQIECDDVVKVANHLSTLSFVDGSRIGIFGWSFGGYLASMAITRGAPAFKAAIAVAPVTDWKYYDNIYTERYMNTPEKNPEGYKNSSVLTYASKLSGNFLLIHGTGDDNVHIQHSYALQEALVNANKQFQSFFYPNKNHGIYGGYTRYHLYKMMTDFLEKNL